MCLKTKILSNVTGQLILNTMWWHSETSWSWGHTPPSIYLTVNSTLSKWHGDSWTTSLCPTTLNSPLPKWSDLYILLWWSHSRVLEVSQPMFNRRWRTITGRLMDCRWRSSPYHYRDCRLRFRFQWFICQLWLRLEPFLQSWEDLCQETTWLQASIKLVSRYPSTSATLNL